jgi:hypothetical protein
MGVIVVVGAQIEIFDYSRGTSIRASYAIDK